MAEKLEYTHVVAVEKVHHLNINGFRSNNWTQKLRTTYFAANVEKYIKSGEFNNEVLKKNNSWKRRGAIQTAIQNLYTKRTNPGVKSFDDEHKEIFKGDGINHVLLIGMKLSAPDTTKYIGHIVTKIAADKMGLYTFTYNTGQITDVQLVNQTPPIPVVPAPPTKPLPPLPPPIPSVPPPIEKSVGQLLKEITGDGQLLKEITGDGQLLTDITGDGTVITQNPLHNIKRGGKRKSKGGRKTQKKRKTQPKKKPKKKSLRKTSKK